MKNRFRALCLIVFVIGIMSVSLAWQKRESDAEPSRPFVAVSYLAESTPDGKMTITSWRTRYVKANGEFRQVMHGTDKAAAFAYNAQGSPGTSSPVLSGTNEGVFIKPSDSTERKSLGSDAAEKSWDASAPEEIHKRFHSHSHLRNHPEFVRMDKYLGFEVYVMRTVADGYWVENSYSPLTGRFPLRMVMHQLDGNEYTIETVKVEFRDVPDNLNEDVKALLHTGNLGDKNTPPKQ